MVLGTKCRHFMVWEVTWEVKVKVHVKFWLSFEGTIHKPLSHSQHCSHALTVHELWVEFRHCVIIAIKVCCEWSFMLLQWTRRVFKRIPLRVIHHAAPLNSHLHIFWMHKHHVPSNRPQNHLPANNPIPGHALRVWIRFWAWEVERHINALSQVALLTCLVVKELPLGELLQFPICPPHPVPQRRFPQGLMRVPFGLKKALPISRCIMPLCWIRGIQTERNLPMSPMVPQPLQS
mmetsp:Transcript_51522/g.120100  ORF Transcript_51522/g.120100 Transcript_51522/m.120100 type:complete len:234 (-) Transcript_51522:705-1406(-)